MRGAWYGCGNNIVIGLLPGATGALYMFAVWEAYMGEEARIPYLLTRRCVV